MTLLAKCHCGATQIELPHVPERAGECNCTFCSRTGAVWAYYKPGELTFVSRDSESDYSASGFGNHHYFCAKCGMHTWGDSPDWSEMYNEDGTPKGGDASAVPTARSYQVNLRLVDGLDWSTVTIEKLDGRNSW